MHEKQAIFARITSLLQSKSPAALATVISTSGSTYRRPGARMLVAGSENLGAVSAGCLEDEVVKTARSVMRLGEPTLIRFDTTEEMDIIAGTGLGCRGTIEVFVEPVLPVAQAVHPYERAYQSLQRDKAVTLALLVKSGREDQPCGSHWLWADGKLLEAGSAAAPFTEVVQSELKHFSKQTQKLTKMLELERERARIYLERIEPAEKLFIFGAGFDAQPLAQMALQLGFRVSVIDHRPGYLLPERFPGAESLIHAHPQELSERVMLDAGSYAVVMTHNYLYDLQILRHLLQSDPRYIGQIGPRSRTEELLAEIKKDSVGLSTSALAGLHAPIGLDLGAETPEEIALSVLAEILAIRGGRRGGFLRERDAPIHEG